MDLLGFVLTTECVDTVMHFAAQVSKSLLINDTHPLPPYTTIMYGVHHKCVGHISECVRPSHGFEKYFVDLQKCHGLSHPPNSDKHDHVGSFYGSVLICRHMWTTPLVTALLSQ